MKKKSVSHKKNHFLFASTAIGYVGDRAKDAIVAVINPLIADAFALYVKTKNFHWHVSGPHFRDYHLLFDEQAEQILGMIDVLAERVRKLGGSTIRSINHIGQLQHIQDDDEPWLEAEEMVRRLLEDNREYEARLVEAHEVCDDHEDVATESILEVFIDETERRVWFLHQTLSPINESALKERAISRI